MSASFCVKETAMISQELSSELHEALVQERDRLQREIANLQGEINREAFDDADWDNADQHPADEGTELFEKEKDLAVRATLSRQLDEVNVALGKFENGTYGICETCGKPIDERRLRAFPAATHDVEHQAEIDRAEGRVQA
jgi:RNA polymerase-binding transcription factor DksA